MSLNVFYSFDLEVGMFITSIFDFYPLQCTTVFLTFENWKEDPCVFQTVWFDIFRQIFKHLIVSLIWIPPSWNLN